MAKRKDLLDWVYEALKNNGGRAELIDVSKYIWDNYEDELRASGNLFFKWQYDMRWAAKILRDQGKMKAAYKSPRGVWELS